jgi:hypothetical protein
MPITHSASSAACVFLTGLWLLVSTPAWSLNLDALKGEAGQGGAEIDNASLSQAQMQDFERQLKQRMPGMEPMFKELGQGDREEVLEVYRQNLDISKSSLKILELSREAVRKEYELKKK